MGIDYSVHQSFGYLVTPDMLTTAFGTVSEAEYRLEDRYDPKTGHKLEQERILVKRAETTYTVDGKAFTYLEDVVEHLCKLSGAKFFPVGSYYTGPDVSYILGVLLPERTPSLDEGHLTISGGCFFEDLLELQADLQRIGEALSRLGLRLDKPVVMPAVLVS